MQLVVLGMHRSGTSLLTSALAQMGCHVGPGAPAIGPWNPRGHWEHPGVVELDDELLATLGANWYDLARLDLGNLSAEDRARFTRSAATLIEGLDEHRPWVIKDPRLCWLFPFWRPLLERPVAILVHRDPVAVAHSLRSRDGFPLPFGVALWEDSLRSALAASAGLPRVLVSHQAMLLEPVATASRMLGQLVALGVTGLIDPEAAAVSSLVEQAMNHHPAGAAERAELLNPAQLALCEALEAGELPAAPLRLTHGTEELLQVYAPQLRRLESAQAERDLLRAHQQIESELRTWVAELEHAKAWLEQQRATWQATAEAQAGRNAELQRRLSELGRDRDPKK